MSKRIVIRKRPNTTPLSESGCTLPKVLKPMSTIETNSEICKEKSPMSSTIESPNKHILPYVVALPIDYQYKNVMPEFSEEAIYYPVDLKKNEKNLVLPVARNQEQADKSDTSSKIPSKLVLNFDNTPLEEIKVEIEKAKNCDHLENVKFRFSVLNTFTHNSISQILGSNKNIEKVCFSHTCVWSDLVTNLFESVSKLQKLCTLKFLFCKFEDGKSLDKISHVLSNNTKVLENLEKLYLCKCSFENAFLVPLCNILKNTPKLKIMEIDSSIETSKAKANLYDAISKLENLESLVLMDFHICLYEYNTRNAYYHAFIGMLKGLSKLKHLKLELLDADQTCAVKLAEALMVMKNLVELDIKVSSDIGNGKYNLLTAIKNHKNCNIGNFSISCRNRK